jgi:basic membrane protein A
VDPSIQILSDYAGVTLAAFNDPFKGKELALSQYDRGVDVVYQAGGATGLGVIEAAKERKLFVIGTDANQNYMAPGQVLTSMVKRGDVAVYDTIQSVVQGTFTGGVKFFDLSNQGVDYAVDEHNKDLLTQEMIDAVDSARKKIIAGEIVVPTE